MPELRRRHEREVLTMVEIIEYGNLEHYEFYCSLCRTRFRARVDDCDSSSYTLGIQFVNLRCPNCKINNCSRRADDFIQKYKSEEADDG